MRGELFRKTKLLQIELRLANRSYYFLRTHIFTLDL